MSKSVLMSLLLFGWLPFCPVCESEVVVFVVAETLVEVPFCPVCESEVVLFVVAETLVEVSC